MKKLPLLFFLLLISSCIKNLDLNQINDLKLKPVMQAPFINIELGHNDFVDGTTEINDFSKKILFDFMNNSIGKNNVRKVGLNFTISNKIKRDFTLNIRFLDENNLLIFDKFKNISIAPESNFTKKELIYLVNNPEFKDVTFVEIDLKMKPTSDGAILDVSDTAKLKINSTVTLYTTF